MTVMVRELKRNLKAWSIWTIVFALYDALIFGMWPSMKEQADAYGKLFDAMPREILAAFGMSSSNFTDILGFFGTYGSIYFVLAGSVYAALLGALVLSREEGEGTAEFLLAQPVSRLSVALQKLGAAFILILSFVAVFMAVSAAYLSILGGGTVSAAHILIIGSGYALSFLVFVALGFLASVFVTRPRSVLPLAMALSFGTYLLGAASRIVPSWEWLEALSPMDWFSTNRSLAEGGLRGGYLAAAIGIIVALPAAAVGLYARKDIKA